LERRKRHFWNQEAVSRAQYIYSLILEKQGRQGEADEQRKAALAIRDSYLKRFPQYLKSDNDDMVVFDQMVCLWGGRFSGGLAQDN